MAAREHSSGLRSGALGVAISLASLKREHKVRAEFWSKLKRVRQVPFREDLVAAFYCALDPDMRTRVRRMLFAAVAYFIVPFDLIPDMIPGLGFADDAALLAAVLVVVSSDTRLRRTMLPRR